MIWARASDAIPSEMDDKIIPLISSANVACGYHASDPVVIREYHPAPRRPASGSEPIRDIRISWDLEAEIWQSPRQKPERIRCIRSAPWAACAGHRGCSLQHVKPHGALYNMAAKDYELSLAICEAVRDYDPG